MNASYQTHVFRYRHDGAEWLLEIKATDADDARARLGKLTWADYQGVTGTKLPVVLAPIGILWVWARNAAARLIRTNSVRTKRVLASACLTSKRDSRACHTKGALRSARLVARPYCRSRLSDFPTRWTISLVVSLVVPMSKPTFTCRLPSRSTSPLRSR